VSVGTAVVAAARLDADDRVVAGVVCAWAALGLWAALRRPTEPAGLLTVLTAALGAVTLLLLTAEEGSEPAEVVGALSRAAGPALLFQLISSLPTGRPADRRRHRQAVAVAWASAAAIAVLGVATRPDPPVAVVAVWSALLGVGAFVLFAATCRRAGPRDRARLQWDGWGVLVAATVAVTAWALDALTGWPSTPSLAAAVATVAVPAGLVAATSEPALNRVARLLVHTIVAIGLVALVIGVYVVVVLGLLGTPDEDARSVLGLSLIAAAIAAALSFPARRRLEEFANQRVYGERSAPDEAPRTFATRMSRAVPMDELLRQLAESLRKSMGVARAEV
jgi:hypothetical protein